MKNTNPQTAVPGYSIPESKSPYAIVIGLDCFTGLQTSRILARRKVPVIGIATDIKHACSRTNVCQKKIKANVGNSEFINLLKSIGPTLKHKAVLFPCTDMSVLLISRNRRELAEWYHFALPEEKVVEMLMDKIKFYTFAMKEGFPIPGTFFLKSRADAEKAAQQLNFPCMLKPPMNTPVWSENAKFKVYRISDAKELLETYDATHRWADMLMVQEWIEGDDSTLYSINCYFDANSEPLATFIAHKIRQWPPRTGVSCLGEEVRNDIVLEESVRLFKHVNYYGLGYVEMKRDVRTGKHYIIEPNIGRPTGRSAITEAGGVELLYTKYCDLLGRALPENRVQKYTGAKWIYLRRDLQSAWYYWRRGELTLPEWWRSIRGRKFYALFSRADPIPFFEDIRSTFVKKGLKKKSSVAKPRVSKMVPSVEEVEIKKQASNL
jgi:predicted ATP-grasp superfamily ATP-dependent carboligase